MRIGTISICEDCLRAFVDGWDDALFEYFVVASHSADLVQAVFCATRLVLGLEEV